jgi:hypothetical protein
MLVPHALPYLQTVISGLMGVSEMALRDIVLPATTPETEWVRGRALQKVSPTFKYSVLQLALGHALRAWIGSGGYVGSEWRFRVAQDERVRRFRGLIFSFLAQAPDSSE